MSSPCVSVGVITGEQQRDCPVDAIRPTETVNCSALASEYIHMGRCDIFCSSLSGCGRVSREDEREKRADSLKTCHQTKFVEIWHLLSLKVEFQEACEPGPVEHTSYISCPSAACIHLRLHLWGTSLREQLSFFGGGNKEIRGVKATVYLPAWHLMDGGHLLKWANLLAQAWHCRFWNTFFICWLSSQSNFEGLPESWGNRGAMLNCSIHGNSVWLGSLWAEGGHTGGPRWGFSRRKEVEIVYGLSTKSPYFFLINVIELQVL